MQKRYPFKFLDAYTREDSAFFFGRSAEIEALYEMVFQTDLLLVYGASGTGKTSLIQCGLASKFQSHDWLALNIRRGQNLNVSFANALEAAGGTAIADHLDWLDDDLSEADNNHAHSPLAGQLKAIYLRHFKPIYLIFDQFEELYILGDQQEQSQFVHTVQEILRVKQPVKIILSIREEYLGHLYEFEREVPELLRKKLRVEPMHLDKVKNVIQSVGNSPHSLIHLQPGEEDRIAESIFEKIRGDEKTLHIPLPYLQVFLDKLYLKVTRDKSRQSEVTFTQKHLAGMGDLGDVLRNFLDEQVTNIAAALSAKEEQVWRALSLFVTLEGTKEPLSQAQLGEKLPHVDPELLRNALQTFVSHRILRFSEATQFYEIAHDALAKQIHAKRSDEEIAVLEVQRLVKTQAATKAEARELFSEKQLNFIEPYLDKFHPSPEELEWIDKSRQAVQRNKQEEEIRKRLELEEAQERAEAARQQAEVAERLKNEAEKGRTRARAFSSLAIGVAFVAVVLGAFALYQWQAAQSANEAALRSGQVAIEALGNYKKERAAKSILEINSLRDRGEILLDNRLIVSAQQLFQQADTLALQYPDLPEMQGVHRDLTKKIEQCKQLLQQ